MELIIFVFVFFFVIILIMTIWLICGLVKKENNRKEIKQLEIEKKKTEIELLEKKKNTEIELLEKKIKLIEESKKDKTII